jgi:SAM-dependent methyltransferase
VHVLDCRNSSAATVVADLNVPDALPADAYDCVLLTQTLQLIYDLPVAVRNLHRALRPGGVLLVTVPGLSQTADRNWRDSWYWGLTTRSAHRLFGDVFGETQVDVESQGNVLAAVGFLHGLAAGELSASELACHDGDYELLVTVRARRAAP